MLLSALAAAWLPSGRAAQGADNTSAHNPIPVMAYYYIWYDPQSWNRAKTDYPLLGAYSSDDREVMLQHVRWAKDAGIEGFIVSWKSTHKLDSRLEQLMSVAADEHFHLWIIYQGLDFERKPLDVEQTEADLAYFVEKYSDAPVFALKDRPVVILSGTWEFSPAEIERITEPYRNSLHILATERNVAGYRRLAEHVDGNAYYWSSVNPYTFPNYQAKLDEIGAAVHLNGGLWVAPAAPGFDARLVGGKTVVDREEGETLRQEFAAALKSAPDAVGLISWNEFSENSHIEPSRNYGSRYLEVVADIQDGKAPLILDFDSNAPAITQYNDFYPLYILASMSVLVVASIAIVARRSRTFRQQH